VKPWASYSIFGGTYGKNVTGAPSMVSNEANSMWQSQRRNWISTSSQTDITFFLADSSRRTPRRQDSVAASLPLCFCFSLLLWPTVWPQKMIYFSLSFFWLVCSGVISSSSLLMQRNFTYHIFRQKNSLP
jgi:hypothetical protein